MMNRVLKSQVHLLMRDFVLRATLRLDYVSKDNFPKLLGEMRVSRIVCGFAWRTRLGIIGSCQCKLRTKPSSELNAE